MPVASHGDVELSESSNHARSRALNQFLAGVELKAFKIAQAALRHEDDALDAVQDAMLQLARAYADKPAEEWKPLFYRILENRIRDMQRRRTVRGRVIAWMPFRGDEEEDEPDPIAQAPSPDPSPVKKLELAEAMGALEKAVAEPPSAAAAGIHAAHARRYGRRGDRNCDGLLRRQRKNTLFSRASGAAGATRGIGMSGQGGEQLTDFERLSRQALEESVLRIDGRVRSRLNQARQAAVEAVVGTTPSAFLAFLYSGPDRGCRGGGRPCDHGSLASRAAD